MLKLFQFKCTECEHEFEELVDSEGDGCADCPECHMPAIRTIGSPCYGKHGSWSQWRAMDNNRG